MIQPRVAESFARQTLLATLRAELLHADDGVCRISAPIGPNALQQHGYAHAGLTFAIGDSAAGYAALTMMPEGSEVLTVEMKINLVAPARGERLIAEGRVRRPGRRIVVVTAELLSEEKLVALLQGTMIPV